MSTKPIASAFAFIAAVSVAVILFAEPAVAEETSFNVSLSAGGDAGDPDGAGQGEITVDSETNQISWDLSYSNIAEPTAMHIHEGAAGQAGGVVVPLTVGTGPEGNLVGLTSAPPDVVEAILASPSGYYVNIHNSEHPRGAIRGQLGN